MPEMFDTFFKVDELEPSLRAAFGEQAPNPKKLLLLAVPIRNPNERPLVFPDNLNRNELLFANGQQSFIWTVKSLTSLFRGDKKPPVLGAYPEAYNECFVLMDMQVLQFCQIMGDRRDAELLEVFSALRRRPDGRSLGYVHDYLWQAAALMLGITPLSQVEFEAILARLERSCRTFERGPTSRNYATTLRNTLGSAG